MKKLFWLLVLALLVVPAFAAINFTVSTSGYLEFSSQLLPTPVTFAPSASLSLKFNLSGDSKTVGNIVAVINGVTDLTQGGGPSTSGSLTFKNLGGLLDLSLNKGTLTVKGTRLVGDPLSGADGFGLVVNTPLKVTAGYKPDSGDVFNFNQGVLAARVDGSFDPVTFYGLVSMNFGVTNFAVGGSVKPVPMVDAFAEYASIAPNWIVGATVKPVAGLTLYGHYKGDNTYIVSATVTTIPNVTLYGEYTGAFYAWAKVVQSLPIGTLTAWGGYRTTDNLFGGYLKLVTPVGPATNTLLARYQANENDTLNPGLTELNLTNKISISF